MADEIIENEETLIASCSAQGSEVKISWASDDEDIQNQIDQLEEISKLRNVKGTYCLKGRCFLRLVFENYVLLVNDVSDQRSAGRD